MIRKALFTAPLLILTLAASGCHHESDGVVAGPDGKSTLIVPLHVSAHASTLGSVAIGPDFTIDPVEADLQEKAIGSNQNEGVEVRAVGSTPADFMNQVLQMQMQTAGVTLGPATAAHHIHVRLTRFFVDEDNTYHGEVAATVEVRDADGKVVTTHAVSGRSNQWGRTLSADNYSEVLSRAAFDFAKNMVSDKELFGGSAPASAPATQ
jgi:hypothetical protein